MGRFISTMFLTVILVCACGKGKGGSGGSNTPEDNVAGEYPKSLAVAKSADLPECNDANNNLLVYVRADKQFQSCDGTDWAVINIDGADGKDGSSGISISENWRYHVDNYSSSTDISSEASTSTYIGTIQLIKFSDGSAFVSVVGAVLDTDGSSDVYNAPFTESFFLPAGTSEQSYISKLKSYSDMRLRLKVTLSATPVLKATVDSDGNFSNNTDATLSLTKQ